MSSFCATIASAGAVSAPAPTRESVERLEGFLLQHPQVDVKTEHIFAPGVYIRQVTFHPDTLATGGACLQDHVSIMVRGHMVALADGGIRDLVGFNQWVAAAGVKRVGYALDETVWQTVHPNPTDERDIAKLEAMLFDARDLRARAESQAMIQQQGGACLS